MENDVISAPGCGADPVRVRFVCNAKLLLKRLSVKSLNAKISKKT